MTPEAAFFKAWGREPSRTERERIRRLQTAFAIDENDALLTIAMVLEFYDGIFRLYPGICAAAVKQALQESLPQAAAAVKAPPNTSAALPSPASSPPSRCSSGNDWVTLGGLTATFLVLFGAGVAIGAALAERLAYLASLAGPAARFAVPIPLVFVGTWGWARIRDARRLQERRRGWIAVTTAVVVIVAWLLLLRAVSIGT
jgi:hypothetical protein